MKITRIMNTMLAGTVISVAATSVSSAEELTIRLDFSPWGIHAAMHLAEQKGWFDEAGLNIDIQDGKGTTNTIQLVGSGQADVGQVQLGLMALARDKGLPLKSFAGWVRKSDLAVLVDASSDIETVSDLAGAKIAAFTASPWLPYIDPFLAAGGLTQEDLSILMVSPSAMVSTYASGEADAFMTTGPFGMPYVADTRPARALLSADYGVAFPSYGLMALEDTIEQRGEELAKLAEIQQRAWEYIYDGHVDEGAQAIMDGRPDSNLDKRVLAAQIEGYRDFFFTEHSEDLPIGIQTQADWEAALSTMEEAGIASAGQVADDYFTNALLPQ